MHPGKRAEFLGWWNECGYPCDAKSFMMYLKQYLEGRVDITARIHDLRYVRTLGFYKATGEHRRTRQWWLYGDPATDMRDPRVHVYPYAEGAD